MFKKLTLKLVLFTLTMVLAFGTSLAAADEITISGEADFADWTPAIGDVVHLTSDGAGGLLKSVLVSVESDSTIILSGEIYAADQYLISNQKTNITVTNETGVAPEVRLTGKSDGFKIQADQTTIKNITLNGTGVADYGFRVQAVNGTVFENVAATNMNKTAFDISRNTNAVYTNITAFNNGGFGITMTQGESVTVSGTTQNNAWGGLNVNNKQQNDASDISTTGIDVSGVASEETMPIVLEQYSAVTPENDVSQITPPAGVDLAASSIVVSNENGIDGGVITSRFILLNPENTPDENGQILAGILKSAVEGNVIEVPTGSYNIGDTEVPASITLEGDGVRLIGSLTRGIDVVIETDGDITTGDGKTSSSGGSGTGSARVVEPTNENTNANASANSNATETKDNSSASSAQNTANDNQTNNENEKQNSADTRDTRTLWVNLSVITAFVVLISGTAYYFVEKNKR
ncbi:hypothetical protein MmiEs2_10670 [Methanimicrococcus stummii]|uniref:Right handed beta helix domain-containing protein n=1 Tax=Methanimicrococcus stummii TaxID=3028294 RepID=A0AA96V944_9EURY|nr:right-handed parallel beta-helix repeat-containing protein [Methanimicrococcus sp. Es2]WNY28859.1 hypothetical protein MmiEs2_10670 [Methanimicrococcus sp. Es2]